MVAARTALAHELNFEISPPLKEISQELVPTLTWRDGEQEVLIEIRVPALSRHGVKIIFMDGLLEIEGFPKSPENNGNPFPYNGFHQRIALSKSLDWESTRTRVEGDLLTIRVPQPKRSGLGQTYFYSVEV